MKVLKKKSKPTSSKETSKAKKRPSMASADWAIQGREERQLAMKRQERESKRNRRPPEVWLRDGESKLLRFVMSEPIASLWRYSVRINGKWVMITAPAQGKKDYMKRSGLQASLKCVYPVIDLTGYVDKKKGKKIRNIPRYLQVSGKLEKQLDKIRERKGGLTKFDIELSRTGEGTDTTYTLIPDERSPLKPEYVKAVQPLFKEFVQYYAPPSAEEQRAMLSGVTREEEDVDEEDENEKKSARRERY